jgi:hypothetical protein
MRNRPAAGNPTRLVHLALVALLLACGVAAPAQARRLHLHADEVVAAAGRFDQVEVELEWPDDAPEGQLHLRARRLDVPSIQYVARDVDWHCPLQRAGEQGWRCSGLVRAGRSAAFPLTLEISPAATRMDLRIGGSGVAFESVAAAPDIARIRLAQVPVAWLKAYLAGLWKEANWTQGRLTGTVDIVTPERGPFEVRTDLDLRKVSLETPTGWLAAADVDARLRLDYAQRGANRSDDTHLTLRGGELLAQQFYTSLPKTPVAVHVLAQSEPGGTWRLPVLTWHDPGVLEASGNARIAADATIPQLDLDVRLGDLSVARDRYLSGFLGPAGFPDLLLTGSGSAHVALRDNRFHAMDAHVAQVTMVDKGARFTFAGVDGDLRWTRDATPVTSRLTWDSGALYGIGLGRAGFDFSSANGVFQTTRPVDVDILGGKLSLDSLRWRPPEGDAGARFEFGVAMRDLDLGSLSQRLGWPDFAGTLSGKLPSARFQDNVLTFDGGLNMQLFGGSVSIGNLVMERPLGVAPTLSADVDLQDIDLEPLTSAFEFGTITGRLDGRIHDLRLVDWQATAFKAWLETDRNWKGKRRISQRAVQDIADVGEGGGLTAGLQGMFLKFFDDFGYDRIGIGCELRGTVCRMEGLGSVGEGYMIVAGAGLPQIKVVGFNRYVDWPTLVSRLEAATQGDTKPVIE